MRGSEGEWKGEWDQRRDIGVTGGSRDRRNREEKGKRGDIIAGLEGW